MKKLQKGGLNNPLKSFSAKKLYGGLKENKGSLSNPLKSKEYKTQREKSEFLQSADKLVDEIMKTPTPHIININGTERLIERQIYGMWLLYLDDKDIEWLKSTNRCQISSKKKYPYSIPPPYVQNEVIANTHNWLREHFRNQAAKEIFEEIEDRFDEELDKYDIEVLNDIKKRFIK